MSWFATRYFVHPCKATLLYKDVNTSLFSIHIVISGTFYTIWCCKLSKNEIYTPTHSKKTAAVPARPASKNREITALWMRKGILFPHEQAIERQTGMKRQISKMTFFQLTAQGRVKNHRSPKMLRCPPLLY